MKRYSITIKGNTKTWCFLIEGAEKYLEDWLEDGLEIDRVISSVDYEETDENSSEIIH